MTTWNQHINKLIRETSYFIKSINNFYKSLDNYGDFNGISKLRMFCFSLLGYSTSDYENYRFKSKKQ